MYVLRVFRHCRASRVTRTGLSDWDFFAVIFLANGVDLSATVDKSVDYFVVK